MPMPRLVTLLAAFACALLAIPALAADSPSPPNTNIRNSPCAHEVPNGATIFGGTGEVYVDGLLIATYGPCNPDAADAGAETTTGSDTSGGGASPLTCPNVGTACTATSGNCCAGEGCNTYQGYCANDFVYAASVAGTAEVWPDAGTVRAAYDLMEVQWVVPSAPHIVGDEGVTFLWNGLQNNDGTLMQPELTYEQAGHNGWQIAVQILQTNGRGSLDGGTNSYPSFFTPSQNVSAGDTIYGYLLMEEGSTPYGDKWLVEVDDTTADLYEYWIYYTGLTATPMTTAWYEVLEIDALATCNGLSPANEETFYLDYLAQEESSSNKTTQINVIPFQTWNPASAPSSELPYCDWNASNTDNVTYGWQWSELSWAY